MIDAFVVDASVAFAWVYPSQASVETDRLLKDVESGVGVVVPSLWLLEVANGLLVAERRKLLAASERQSALETLANLAFTVDEQSSQAVFGKTSDLAEKYGLSVYDATYFEVALRRKLPLASRDKALRAAARQCRVRVRA